MNWPTFFTAFAGGLTALLIGGPVIVWVIVQYLEGFADELRDDLSAGRPSFTPSASRPASSGVSPAPSGSWPFGQSYPVESQSWPPYAYTESQPSRRSALDDRRHEFVIPRPEHQGSRTTSHDDYSRYDQRRYR